MPICPNKSSKEWKDLIAGLKAKKPNDTDERINDYALFTFFEKGDGTIPTVDEANKMLFIGKTRQVKINILEKIVSLTKLGKEGVKVGKRVQKKESDYSANWLLNEKEIASMIAGKREGRKEGIIVERGMQKEFAKKISKYLNLLVGAGDISATQAAAIARKAAKVGTSELALQRFIDYTNKVVDNANYENEMSEIRKLQKAAIKGKSALSSTIKIFAKINPEDLPTTMVDNYKQALLALTSKVKNPTLMREMFLDVYDIAFKAKSESDNYRVNPEINGIKTITEAENIYKSLQNSQINTIEDYEQAIRDSNSLSKKINKLFNEGKITEQEYEDLNNNISKTQVEFEQKNQTMVAALKQDIVKDILSKKINPSYEITEEEKLLLSDISDLKYDDLMRISLGKLYILNQAIDVANESYIDVNNIQNALNDYSSSYAPLVTEQLNKLKNNDIKTQELVRRMMTKEDVFWEDALRLPASKVGALFLEIIAPYRKGLGNYVRSVNDVIGKILKIEGKYKITKEQHHKIGMIVHFLQEYMRQFDPKYKNLQDIGKRDEFAEKLFDDNKTNKIDSRELTELLQKVYNKIPKGKDGKVDIEDVYKDYESNGNKYLTEQEREYLDNMFDFMETNISGKQDFANAMRDKPFDKIDFYMPRVEYGSVQLAGGEAIEATGNRKNISIKSPTGEARTARDIINTEIPKTDILFLMTRAAKSTVRDYHITKMLKDLNKRLNKAYQGINQEKYLDAVVIRMMEGLKQELEIKESDSSASFVDNVLSASAMSTLANPIRTFGQELPSGIFSYPLRAGVSYVRAYTKFVKNSELTESIKEFTNSPLAIKENIQASFDADSQEIKVPNFLKKYVTWNSALTERVLNNSIWYPKFEDAFLEITGKKFDYKKFETDKAYKKEFKKELNDAGSIADQSVQEVIGSTTAGSAKVIVDDLLTTGASKIKNVFSGTPIEGGLSKKSTWGKMVGYMGNWAYRDYATTMKGLREFREGVKNNDISTIKKGLLKPFGVLVGNAIYGYTGALSFLLSKYIISQASYLISGNKDDKDVIYARERLNNMLDIKGALKELTANGTQIAMGKYGSDSRMLVSALGTFAYHTTKDEETRKDIENFVQSVTFKKIPKIDKINEGYYGKKTTESEISLLMIKSIPTAAMSLESLVNQAGGIKGAIDLITKLENGEDISGKEVLAKSLKFAFSTMQTMLILSSGVSIPESKKIQEMLDKINRETKSAGVGSRTSNRRSSRRSAKRYVNRPN